MGKDGLLMNIFGFDFDAVRIDDSGGKRVLILTKRDYENLTETDEVWSEKDVKTRFGFQSLDEALAEAIKIIKAKKK